MWWFRFIWLENIESGIDMISVFMIGESYYRKFGFS